MDEERDKGDRNSPRLRGSYRVTMGLLSSIESASDGEWLSGIVFIECYNNSTVGG